MGSLAFNGQDMLGGGEGLYWNAALRLVRGVGAFAGGYDANGNLTSRVVDGAGQLLGYDAENRLTGISGSASASFFYDGDGARVKGTVGEVTTTYIGNWFEWTGSASTMKRYYYAGGTRVAMRVGSTTLYYLLGDHLGSTSVIANPSGGMAGMQYYEAWGETRYTSGTQPTTYQYTGQRHEQSVGGGLEGLYFYGARWLDVALGRFLSADSIIPEATQGVQAWDRFAYANNNPVRYTDPTGHMLIADGDKDQFSRYKANQYKPKIWVSGYTEGMLRGYHESQTDRDNCAPYSIAMAINLRFGPNDLVNGEDVELYAEATGFKFPGLGMPPRWQSEFLKDQLPGEDVEYSNNLSIDTIIDYLKRGYLIIVSVSWGGTLNPDTYKKGVGHAMVLVGYDTASGSFMLLDPSTDSHNITYLSGSDFYKMWSNQPNIFIPSNSTVTIK